MTTQIPSRAAVDRAEPLTFDRKPARQELTITVHAKFNGFDTEICFSGQLEQLDAITKRLAALGGEPVPSAAPQGQTALRKSSMVAYADDGSPLCGNANCSRHGQPLAESQHNGFFCKGKDAKTGNAKGYCKTTAE